VKAKLESKEQLSVPWGFFLPVLLLGIAELLWFRSKCINQIDFDGMAYVGIARHIREGAFHSAINAFRSPLSSWLIAALSVVCKGYLQAGKVVSIGSWLLCSALLYVLAFRLWRSQVVAALASFLFVLGRGLCAIAIAFVTPDYLFAALVVMYFLVLRECVLENSSKKWFLLGAIHGLAFLTKAFALPWLCCSTTATLLLLNKPWKTKLGLLASAALIPAVTAAGWAAVLHSKYGVYSTGSQFKANFLQWVVHERPVHLDDTYRLLRDTSKDVDEYTVADPMPPGSWAWNYHISVKGAIPRFLLAERRNIPKALKELTIVVTPGVFLAFSCILIVLTSQRRKYPVEWLLVVIISASAVSLILAYSLLVFDERYLFPLIPLLLAVGARFLVADPELNHTTWRNICIALTLIGLSASLAYRSSPFRVLTRDFQLISYQTGAFLESHKASARVVSIGSGPFPEYGVGWEVGYQTAFFGGGRLVATADSLPHENTLGVLEIDLARAAPDAIVVWGKASDPKYAVLIERLASDGVCNISQQTITDPVVGDVGLLRFCN
jgi:hypothetical protein